MNLRLGSVVTIFATLGLSACDGIDESGIDGEGVVDQSGDMAEDEALGTSQEAITAPCAAGTDPNATIFLTSVGLSGSTEREAVFINPGPNPPTGCGPTPRATTRVDWMPSSSNTHRYRFRVIPDVGPIGTTKATCETMQFKTRILDDNEDTIDLFDLKGVWLQGIGCHFPYQQIEYTHLNKNGSTRRTSRYTVASFMRKANGTFGRVLFSGINLP